ncbi:hypothetical protein BJY00DRAFT_146940 [Aspergillus carlsbadensis]|nr:hypothetical protein BJY00DRAFT_146940 [Aspergillus carlsbadensis]
MHSDLIVLSSSPERNAISTPPPLAAATEKGPQQHTRAASSSPVPSPTEVLCVPQSRSGFFATLDHNLSSTQDRITMREKRAAADSVSAISDTAQKRKGRKPTLVQQVAVCSSNSADVENEGNTTPKAKRTRKKRANGGAGSEKTKNKTIVGKLTKPRARKPKESGASTAVCPSTPAQTRRRSAGKDDTGLHLEPALKRRLDWTPTKDVILEDRDNAGDVQSKLGTILSGYEYEEVPMVSDKVQVLGDEGPTKRRRIELVDSTFNAPRSKSSRNNPASDKVASPPADLLKSSKKSTPRPKRFTTLTARVTAPYLETAESTDTGIFIAPDKPNRKANPNSALKPSRTIVLSPETALKTLEGQDLVFGTCSQLEREDSPILLQETKIALEESEKDASASSLHQTQDKVLAQFTSAPYLTKPSRNLWAVAARDSEGLLRDVEVIELLDTPQAAKTIILPDDGAKKMDQRIQAHDADNRCDILPAKEATTDSACCIEGLPGPAMQAVEHTIDEPNVASETSMPDYKELTDADLAKKIKSNGLKAIKNRKKMIEVLEKCWAAQHGRSNQEEGDDLQNTEFSKQGTVIAKAQKASKKSRKPRAISQKKEEQYRPPGSVSTKAEADTTTTALSKSSQLATQLDNVLDNNVCTLSNKPCQQPTLIQSFVDIEEIQDSEDELLPSPSRLQIQLFDLPRESNRELSTSTNLSSPAPSRPASSNRNFNRALTTTVTTTKFGTSLPSKDNTDERLLLEFGDLITKAVRAQPRNGHSSSRLSWHEKILMYDPIYLEDFTAWLNTEGLSLVHEDREVGASLVRRWCESKGICCCYKVKTIGHS